MQTETKIIMRESPEAATYRTNLSGWVSSTGRYFGNGPTAEQSARYEGSTHHLCECGKIAEKSYGVCPSCRHKNNQERYLKLPAVEWDGVTPIILWDDDKYFFCEGDLLEWCENNETQPESLMLMECVPNYLSPIDYGYWDDQLPEDGDIPKVVKDAIDTLNAVLKTYNDKRAISWSQGRRRIIYTESL